MIISILLWQADVLHMYRDTPKYRRILTTSASLIHKAGAFFVILFIFFPFLKSPINRDVGDCLLKEIHAYNHN